jgi:hypothetical protein
MTTFIIRRLIQSLITNASSQVLFSSAKKRLPDCVHPFNYQNLFWTDMKLSIIENRRLGASENAGLGRCR